MSNKTITAGILVDDASTFSYLEVCETYQITENELIDMLEYGLFEVQSNHIKNVQFDQKMLSKVQTACRLQRDLEINLPGVVLVLELLDELASIRDELNILRRHID